MQPLDCNVYYSNAMALFRTIFILETIELAIGITFSYREYQHFLFLAIRENLAIACDSTAESYRPLPPLTGSQQN